MGLFMWGPMDLADEEANNGVVAEQVGFPGSEFSSLFRQHNGVVWIVVTEGVVSEWYRECSSQHCVRKVVRARHQVVGNALSLLSMYLQVHPRAACPCPT